MIPSNTFHLVRKKFLVSSVSFRHFSKLEPSSQEDKPKVVTKKKYKELPLARRLPNGSDAAPLNAWCGGLESNQISGLFPYAGQAAKPPKKCRHTVTAEDLERTSKGQSAATKDDTCTPRLKKVVESMHQDFSIPTYGAVETEHTDERKQSRTVKAKRKSDDGDGDGDLAILDSIGPIDTEIALLEGTLKSKGRRRKSTKLKTPCSAITDDSLYMDEDRAEVKEIISEKLVSSINFSRILEQHTGGSKRKRSPRKAGSDEINEMPRLPQNQLAVEILDNLARFPHCILLTRVGNFYESYFDQAAEVARLLSIKLTKRTWDRQEILMCGFPVMHLDRYLKVLVQTHKRYVALCEEFKRSPPDEGFERRVVRVLTPGTLIDESFLNPYENNYLLAISSSLSKPSSDHIFDESTSNSLGLAWIDVSTGEFFTQQSTLATIKDDLARIAPREVVLPSTLHDASGHPIRLAVTEEDRLISYIAPKAVGVTFDSTHNHVLELVDDVSTKTSPLQSTSGILSTHEAEAIVLMITFLQANLLEYMPSLSSPTSQGQRDRMHIDSQTIKTLEIREEMREGGVTGSLLSVIRRTVTTSGTRLLARWLCSPSTSVVEIETRQNLVSLFLRRPHLRLDVIQLLKRLEDASRIVQRFLSGKGDVSDLSAIKNTIDLWNAINHRIVQEYQMERTEDSNMVGDEWTDVKRLLARMADLNGLGLRIRLAVDSQVSEQSITDIEGEDELHSFPGSKDAMRANISIANWTGQLKSAIKPNFSDELALLHTRLADNQAARQRLEQELQRRYDAPSLTLRSSGRAGIHVHVARPNRDAGKIDDSPHFIPISVTSSTKTYFNQTWYLLGTAIIEVIMQIFAAEKTAFETLRQEVNHEALALRRNARIADELDVTIGFASLADEMKLVRPTLNESTSFSIINGRHPSVELGLLSAGRVFTPNTVCLTPHSRLHIITGPNMAGKSTLLRQTALLAILAQIGSFVPADKAEIGIVDKMFARIGANDDLFRDRSTFMVEMLETSNILQRATDRSLVIMDEVGRGTTVTDGLAIAFATIFYLYTHNRCRTLFATHFHEVADMVGYEEGSAPSGYFKDIGFFCTNVDETIDGHFAYSHRLRPGMNRDSHGLKVARLAGLPPPAMRMAQDALDWMGSKKGSWMADTAQLRLAGQNLLSKHRQMSES